MADKKPHNTTFGLRPEKLGRLLRLGSDSAEDGIKTDLSQSKTEYLRSRLEDTLPLGASVRGNLPPELTRFSDTISAACNLPVGTLLLDPKTDISLLRAVKDYSKKLSTNATSEVEHHGANTLYYAAIASALCFHSERITRFTWEELEDSFGQLMKAQWIPKSLAELFAEAQTLCKSKLENKG